VYDRGFTAAITHPFKKAPIQRRHLVDFELNDAPPMSANGGQLSHLFDLVTPSGKSTESAEASGWPDARAQAACRQDRAVESRRR
jgi:hypothetical protein